MEALMILAVIAIFFINFIFIDKIYKIVDNPADPLQVSNKSFDGPFKDALILGNDAICESVIELLKKQNILSDKLINIDDIDKSYPYKYVVAGFNDDLENLTVCTIAINIMGINNVIAVCNKQYNKKIYDENNIITISSYSSAFEIVSLLLNNQNSREA